MRNCKTNQRKRVTIDFINQIHPFGDRSMTKYEISLLLLIFICSFWFIFIIYTAANDDNIKSLA